MPLTTITKHDSSPNIHQTNTTLRNSSKEDMTAIVEAAFSARHIDPRRTKLGRDIVFRKGDPCNNHDLVCLVCLLSLMPPNSNHTNHGNNLTFSRADDICAPQHC